MQWKRLAGWFLRSADGSCIGHCTLWLLLTTAIVCSFLLLEICQLLIVLSLKCMQWLLWRCAMTLLCCHRWSERAIPLSPLLVNVVWFYCHFLWWSHKPLSFTFGPWLFVMLSASLATRAWVPWGWQTLFRDGLFLCSPRSITSHWATS